MKQWFVHNQVILSIAGIAITVFLVMLNINGSKDYASGYIEADGKGYYAYLPAVFVYNDLNFSFFDDIEKKKYYNENHYYDYRYTYDGKIINKYYSGTALMLSPFFLAGHLLSIISDAPADGYSKIYIEIERSKLRSKDTSQIIDI